MKVGSLFSGIGGIDLGLERAGMEVRWQSEIDPYCSKVLAKHWPTLPNLGDITQVDWTHIEPVDLICGGFPCQPVSLAGKGKAQADHRWLWPSFAKAVFYLRPRIILVENVPGLTQRGLDIVLGEMAELGYDAEWASLPASAFGALHRRTRLYIVAHTNSPVLWDQQGRPGRASGDRAPVAEHDGEGWPLADPAGAGLEGAERQGRPADSGAERPVADANREGQLQQGGPEQPLGRRPGDSGGKGGAAVADADSLRRCERSGSSCQQAGRGQPADSGGERGAAPLADPARLGQRESAVQADPLTGGRQARSVFGGGSQPRPDDTWAAEPAVGRVAHGVPHRVDRLRALGNAVVPQAIEWIGNRIMEAS